MFDDDDSVTWRVWAAIAKAQNQLLPVTVKGGMATIQDTIYGQPAASTPSGWHVSVSEPSTMVGYEKREWDWSSQAFPTIINSVWLSVTSQIGVPRSLKSYGDWWLATGERVGHWKHLVNSLHIRWLGCDGSLLLTLEQQQYSYSIQVAAQSYLGEHCSLHTKTGR